MGNDRYKQMLVDVVRPSKFINIDQRIDEAIDEYLFYNNSYIVDEGVKDWLKSGVVGASMLASTLGGVNAAQAAQPAAQPAQSTKVSRSDIAQTKATNHTNILRSIYDLAKQSHDGGDRADAVALSSQLQKWAPEYYGKGAKYHISYTELALMPDDAYEEFLDQLKYNIQEKEKAETKHQIQQWTDSAGNTFEARLLRFDAQGDHQGLNGWVWMDKDGQKVRLPFRYLSQQSQNDIIQILKN